MNMENDTLKVFVKDYFADKLKYMIAAAGSAAAVAVFLWLIGTRKIFIVFLVLLFFLPLLPVFAWDFYHRVRYYREVMDRMGALYEKTLLHDVIDEADFAEGKLLQMILAEADLSMFNQIMEIRRNLGEYREYVEVWVHEIKTPIALLNLLLDRLDDSIELLQDQDYEEAAGVKKQMNQELKRVDMLVEQALYYARSTFVEKDFVAENIALNELVSDALKENSMALISAKAVISMNGLEYKALADRKWMKFILSQIITNSVKYKKDVLSLAFNGFAEKERVRLVIQDNGIGISERDIGRVFDKGFTGENGRNGAKSTGIGLYLCRKLCDKMNLKIEASSKKGEGTIITIVFPVGSMVTELT